MTVDDLFEEVKRGRSVWIGMFPEYSEDLNATRLKILAQNEGDFAEDVPSTKLHITLAHLGKGHSLTKTFAVHAAMEVTSGAIIGEQKIKMTGVLRLKNHVTIALVPDRVIAIREMLVRALVDRSAKPDDTFGMIPHISIAKIGGTVPRCPAVIEKALVFRGLTMVSGEARIYVPFSEGPF